MGNEGVGGDALRQSGNLSGHEPLNFQIADPSDTLWIFNSMGLAKAGAMYALCKDT